MSFIFATLVLLLSLASAAGAAISNTDSAISADAICCYTTQTAAFAGSQASGNVGIALVVIDRSNGDTTSTVSDSVGSTWTQITTISQSSVRTELWASTNILSANVTVTATFGASTAASLAVASYSGVSSLGTNNSTTGTGTTIWSISLTTQDNNNFIVGGFGARTGAGTSISAGSGNLRQSLDGTGNDSAVIALADNTAGSPSSVTISVNTADTFDTAQAVVELRSTVAAFHHHKVMVLQ